jgi:hypothetical protein
MAWTILEDGGSGERAAILMEDAVGNSKTLNFDAEQALIRSRRFTIDWVSVDYVPTAGAGNRGLVLELLDAADGLLAFAVSGATVIASTREVSMFFHLAANSVNFTTAGGTAVVPLLNNDPLPMNMMLFAGLKLRIRDPNNIAAGDSIKVMIGGRLS